MTSNAETAYVWVWLPVEPGTVVADRIDPEPGEVVTFAYGQCYLDRDEGIALYEPELPLQRGAMPDARYARVADSEDYSDIYLLDRSTGKDIVDRQVSIIDERWDDVADAARIGDLDRERMGGDRS